MRVIITGTTSGLGKALAQAFTKHDVKELNRPDFDLRNDYSTHIRDDWDIFINNAYHGWTQVDLLYALFEANKHRSCMIINIGSVSGDKLYDTVFPYSVHKKALELACRQLQQVDSQCRVVCVKLGRMETPMVAHRTGPKLDPAAVASAVANLTQYAQGPMTVKELVLDNYYGD